MKTKRKVVGMLAGLGLLAVLLAIPGCEKPKPETIKKAVRIAGKEGTLFGLKKWSETKPEEAREAATALKKNIDDVLLPYMAGGNLPSSAEVQAFIQSSLFKDVKDEIKSAIILASVALDSALPVPAADTYLKPEHVEYIKEFLGGVSDGCGAFLSRDIGGPKTNWIK